MVRTLAAGAIALACLASQVSFGQTSQINAGPVPDGLTAARTLAAFHERTPSRVADTTVAVSSSLRLNTTRRRSVVKNSDTSI